MRAMAAAPKGFPVLDTNPAEARAPTHPAENAACHSRDSVEPLRQALRQLLGAVSPATAARLAVGLARAKMLLRAEASPERSPKAEISIHEALARDLIRLVAEHFHRHGHDVLDGLLLVPPLRYLRFANDVMGFQMLGDGRCLRGQYPAPRAFDRGRRRHLIAGNRRRRSLEGGRSGLRAAARVARRA